MLPLPRTHPESTWDATPEPVLRALLLASRKRGAVLDPFCGAGTVGRVALGLGREWIGVERDPRMARLTARRLKLVRAQAGSGLAIQHQTTADDRSPPRSPAGNV
jgi:modification methylase